MSMSEPMVENVHDLAGKVALYVSDFLAEPVAFRGQQLRGGGAIAEFEDLLARRCGFRHCVAISNATTALLALACILNVRSRKVFFPLGHWQGSMAAFRLMGAKVRFYYSQSPPALCNRADGPPMLLVCGSNFDKIDQGVTNSNCIVVEDSNRIPGISTAMESFSHADVQILSFGPGKPLSLGEGGAALFRNSGLKNRFLSMTQHPERLAVEIGAGAGSPRTCLNGRIHPIAALIGAELLKTLEGADMSPSSIVRAQCHTPIHTPIN